MIAVLKHGTTKEQTQHLLNWLKHMNLDVHISEGAHVTVLGLIGDTSRVDMDLLKSLEIVETVKRAEDGDGWIVRMYECDNAKTPAVFTWNRAVASVEECNCIEEKVCDMAAADGQVKFVIKPLEIKSFRIREK